MQHLDLPNETITANQTVNETVTATFQQIIAEHLAALSPVESFAVILVFSLVMAKIIQVAGARLARQVLGRTESELDTIVFEELHAPLYITVAVSGAYFATIALRLPEPLLFYVRGIVATIIVVIWSRAFIRTGNRFLKHMQESSKRPGFAHIFENIWTFIILIFAVFALLSAWNIDVTPLLASAGVAGIVVGFAARDAVANLFGGIALYFDDTYNVGDYIVLESGEEGTVVDIGIRSTTIITRDDITASIPNSVLNSSMVINESAPKERKRITVPVGVAYGTDIDKLEEVLTDVAEEEENVLGHPTPRVQFREFGDSALQYVLLCWVEAPLKDLRTKHELNRKIYTRLDEEGIEIPFPQRDIHMDDRTGNQQSVDKKDS